MAAVAMFVVKTSLSQDDLVLRNRLFATEVMEADGAVSLLVLGCITYRNTDSQTNPRQDTFLRCL